MLEGQAAGFKAMIPLDGPAPESREPPPATGKRQEEGGLMFERLTDKIQGAVKSLRGQGRITETNIQESLRAVRLALLEADVHVSSSRIFSGASRKNLSGGRSCKASPPTSTS